MYGIIIMGLPPSCRPNCHVQCARFSSGTNAFMRIILRIIFTFIFESPSLAPINSSFLNLPEPQKVTFWIISCKLLVSPFRFLLFCSKTVFTIEEGWTGDGVRLQAYLHSWCVVWACLSSLLGLMTKILLSHFLIGLKLFHVKSGRKSDESSIFLNEIILGLLFKSVGPFTRCNNPDYNPNRRLLSGNNFRPIQKWLNRISVIKPQ